MPMANLKPLGDKVVIRPQKEEERTKSGIVLPATAEKEKPEQGEIIAVGPGKTGEDGKVIPMTVKVGDKVLFTQYGPSEIKIDDEELLVVSESDVLAVIE